MRPSRSHRRARRRSRAGFTLIELLIIVAIILVTAALAAPGMMRAMAINRAQRATSDVARLVREARHDSVSYGRAYLLVYSAGSGRGRLELWRGVTDTCRTNAWNDIVVANGCWAEPRSADCVDALDVASYATSSHWVELTAPANVTRVCFEPDDEIWTSSGGAFTQPTAALQLPMTRFENGTALEQRGVIIPLSGAPRIQ